MKNKYLIATCLIISLLTTTKTFSQGIQFKQGEWQSVLMQAKSQNRLIFVDVYTDWCGPCKEMDKKTFTDATVGDKFNAKFVNYKVNADKGFGVTIAKRYNVTSYPTVLFIDPSENLIHKQQGYLRVPDLLKEADMVIANQSDVKPIYVLDKLYNEGRRDSEFLYEYLAKRARFNQNNTKLVDEYLKSLNPLQYSADRTLRVMINNGIEIDGKAFEILMKFREKAMNLFEDGERKIDGVFSMSINEAFEKAITAKNIVAFEKVVQANTKALPNTADRVNDKNRLSFYLATKDVAKFTEAAQQYLDQYVMFVQVESIRKQDAWEFDKIMSAYKQGVRDSTGTGAEFYQRLKREARNTTARMTANELNEVVKAYFDNVVDNTHLAKSTEWAKRAIELVEHPDYYDSYAHILLKIGDKQKAQEMEQKAVEVAMRDKIDIQKFTAALEKMR
jgi:thiol-disulfide isomerase/thioredoxin